MVLVEASRLGEKLVEARVEVSWADVDFVRVSALVSASVGNGGRRSRSSHEPRSKT